MSHQRVGSHLTAPFSSDGDQLNLAMRFFPVSKDTCGLSPTPLLSPFLSLIMAVIIIATINIAAGGGDCAWYSDAKRQEKYSS